MRNVTRIIIRNNEVRLDNARYYVTLLFYVLYRTFYVQNPIGLVAA
jgi:hypothetical protein